MRPYLHFLVSCALLLSLVTSQAAIKQGATNQPAAFDDDRFGDLKISARGGDHGNWMKADARAISRTAYQRLFKAICPEVSGCITINGSAQVALPLGAELLLTAGMVIEGTGITSGTVLNSVGTTTTAIDGGTISGSPYLFVNMGETLGDTTGVGISGSGIQALTTVSTILSPFTGGNCNVTSGGPGIFHQLGFHPSQTVVVGDFMSAGGNTYRVGTCRTAQTENTGNTRVVSGSPTVYLQYGYSANPDILRVGRAFTTTAGFTTGTAYIITVPNNDTTDTSSWTFTTAGVMIPIDKATTELIINRKLSGGPTADANAGHIVSVVAQTTGTASIESGSPNLTFQVAGSPTPVVDRFIGGNAGIPTDSYASSVQTSGTTTAFSRTISGVSKLFFPTSTVTTSFIHNRYWTLAGGLSEVRQSGSVHPETSSMGRQTTASPTVWLGVGFNTANLSVGQQVTGTGIPANTTQVSSIATGFLAETAVTNCRTVSGSAVVNIAPGADSSIFVGSRTTDINAGGGTIITTPATSAEFTRSGIVGDTLGGNLNTVYFNTGTGIAVGELNRVIAGTGLDANGEYITASVADFSTTATSRVLSGTSVIAHAIGQGSASGMVGSYMTVAAGGITNARVTSMNAESTYANMRTTNTSPVLNLTPASSTSADFTAGTVVTGSGVPASTIVVSYSADTSVTSMNIIPASACFTVGTTGSELTVGRRITGTGIVAANYLASQTFAESTAETVDTVSGAPEIFLLTTSALTSTSVGRFIDVTGFPTGTTYLSSNTANFTVTNNRSVAASPNIGLPIGQATTSMRVGQRYSNAGTTFGSATVKISSITAQTTATARNITTTTTIGFNPGTNLGDLMIGRQMSGTGIPALANITSISSSVYSLTCSTTNASTTVTTSSTTGLVVGQKLSGTGFGANTAIASITNATTFVVTVASTATGAGIATTLGPVVVSSANNASTNVAITVTLGPVLVMSTNATTTAGATGTFGGFFAATTNASATGNDLSTTIGSMWLLGIAGNTSGLPISTAVLGARLTVNNNATLSSTSIMTGGQWEIVNASATATSAVAVATAGGHWTASTTHSVAGTTQTFTVGRTMTTSSNASATAFPQTITFGGQITLSANATTTTTQTNLYGPWVDLVSAATGSVQAASTGGAYVVLNNNATATVTNFTAKMGGVVNLVTAPASVQRNTSIRLGAIFTASANSASTSSNTNFIGGAYEILTTNYVGSTITNFSGSTTHGARLTLSQNANATANSSAYVMGATATCAAAATGSGITVLRFFPYGGGNGTTTFNIPPSIAGRTIIGAGTGAGLTARTINQTMGTETHTLTAAQSGLPSHTHGVGNTLVISQGIGGNVNGVDNIAGTINLSTDIIGGAQNASQAHNIMQPSWVGGHLFIYVGPAQ